MTFPACEQRLVEKTVRTAEGDKAVRGIEWDVSHSMKRCVAKYETAAHAITGRYPRIAHADTRSWQPRLKPQDVEHLTERRTMLDDLLVVTVSRQV